MPILIPRFALMQKQPSPYLMALLNRGPPNTNIKQPGPETVINKYFDPNWRPHLQTPPFPEYTCGHCTISAAAAEALSSVLGDNVAYTDTSELEFGIKNRSFKSFRDAAATKTFGQGFMAGYIFTIHALYRIASAMIVGDSVVKKLVMKR